MPAGGRWVNNGLRCNDEEAYARNELFRPTMIRKLPSGGYRLYSRKKNLKTGKRRNLGTFATRAEAVKHERAIQFFKKH